MATPEDIRKIAQQVAARTGVFEVASSNPDAQEAFVSSVERTLGRVDRAVGGRYRSLILSASNLSRAVSDREKTPDVDLTGELKAQVKGITGDLDINSRAVSIAVKTVFENGVSMLVNGFTDIGQLDALKRRISRARTGASPTIRQGSTFTASKEGVPQTVRTGLTRRITG